MEVFEAMCSLELWFSTSRTKPKNRTHAAFKSCQNECIYGLSEDGHHHKVVVTDVI